MQFRGGETTYINQIDENEENDFLENEQGLPSNNDVQNQFKVFLKSFKADGEFKYSQMIQAQHSKDKYYISVELGDLTDFEANIASAIKKHPARYLPILEQGLREYTKESLLGDDQWQVQFVSEEQPLKIRQLRSEHLNQLVTIEGIIVSVSQPYQRAKTLSLLCTNCQDVRKIELGSGMENPRYPRICLKERTQEIGNEECPKDPYIIQPENCEIIDQQFCKIQESNETIPTGEIPRTFSITLDRYIIDRVVPGQTIKLTGIYKILDRKQITAKGVPSSLKLPYIQVLGVQKFNAAQRINFTEEEITDLKTFAKQPNFFEKISENIAPSIYGRDSIKQAIACLLFGGSKKILPDKTKLRGDINVLLIGDPSTGKSQFLKFVEKLSPVSIYTSGKGSSAAGLTASVVKNFSTGEFQIEGGAMVLADGGIVCIDEFDKMRPEDRVAIHEAMEQQTISVSKAGFTTKLNSRCSVLAAANPIFGSYSNFKDISEQIELQTTILSRFDCIFIVRDNKDREEDSRIVEHILNLHSNQENQNQLQNNQDLIDPTLLYKFITYAKTHVDPRLSNESAQKIVNLYVNDREKAKESGNDKSKKAHIPITVRQLEAMIRLSESIAKINLSESVTPAHIEQAHKLFTESTMNAIGKAGSTVGLNQSPETQHLIMKIQNAAKTLVSLNGRKKTRDFKESLITTFKNEHAVDQAIVNLVNQGEFKMIQGNHVVQRIR